MADEKDRFGKVAASQNSPNLTERGIIGTFWSTCYGLAILWLFHILPPRQYQYDRKKPELGIEIESTNFLFESA